MSCLHVCLYHIYTVCTEASWCPLGLESHSWLWIAMWVLGFELWSSRRVAIALNCLAEPSYQYHYLNLTIYS